MSGPAGIRYPLLYWKLAVFQFVGSKIPGRLGKSQAVGNYGMDLCQLQGSSSKRIYDLLEMSTRKRITQVERLKAEGL